MDNLRYVGPIVHYPRGAASVEVVAPAWLLDDVQALPCVQSAQPAEVMINGQARDGLRVWLVPTIDPVEAVLQIETLLDLGAAWEDLLADVPILEREA
jgi:hypothetical protein